tara:strand:+ start:2729 stop:4399 length:1671 start_codon:yes stop_codon:yes gene_type:complete
MKLISIDLFTINILTKVKKLLKYFLLALYSTPFIIHAQNQVPIISNVEANLDLINKAVYVNFDLNDEEGDEMEVWIQASVDGGKTWAIPIISDSLSGDYGDLILSGNGKSIIWSYDEYLLSNYSQGLTTLQIRVIADDHIEIPLSEIVAKVDSARIVSSLYQYEGIRNHFTDPAFKNKIIDSLETLFGQADIYNYRHGPMYGGYQIENIIGFSSGTRTPQNSWLTSAHYDTVDNSPGTDDNGTGMVAVAEAVRILSDYNTKNSLRYLFFDLEEYGLIGSQFYVNTGVPFWENMQGLINMDMIGYYSDEPYSQTLPVGFDFLYPEMYSDLVDDSWRGNWIGSIFNNLATNLNNDFTDIAETYVPDLKIHGLTVPGNGELVPDLRRSDHAPFWDIGVPSLFLTDCANFRNPYYHTLNDVISTVNIDFLINNIKAIVTTLALKAELEHSAKMESNIMELELTLENIELKLEQNSIVSFPNPSDGIQDFQINLIHGGMVKFIINDMTGRVIDITSSQWMPYGQSVYNYNKNLSEGYYYVSLELDGQVVSSNNLIIYSHSH